MNKPDKNSVLLAQFVDYCAEHPSERFWQALRNWMGVGFVLVADNFIYDKGHEHYTGIQDTFSWEEVRLKMSKPKSGK